MSMYACTFVQVHGVYSAADREAEQLDGITSHRRLTQTRHPKPNTQTPKAEGRCRCRSVCVRAHVRACVRACVCAYGCPHGVVP